MILIKEASVADINTIQEIAHATWPDTYKKILSETQLEFMLDKYYATDLLVHLMTNENHYFILAYENEDCLGFASYQHHYLEQAVTRLHKIYLLPSAQGKGVGKLLLDEVEKQAKSVAMKSISLNVNKFNKAATFYKKIGFKIIAEEDLEIGEGYLMEDFKMEKTL